MTSLPKQWQNSDLRETKQMIYHSKGIDESFSKMYLLLNLSHYVKSYWHFGQILAFLMMPIHQIWSCHMTQETNFKSLLFCPNSTFNINIGKSHKISGGQALYFRSYQPQTSRGWKTPRSAFRVNLSFHVSQYFCRASKHFCNP